MAVAGRKPKPPVLRIVEGNRGRRPIPPDILVDPAHDNGLTPPSKLKKRERELWTTFIRRCSWLTELDTAVAVVFVSLFAEFEKNPAGMVAARIAQLRAASSELGLDPSSRQRLAASAPAPQAAANDPARKYLA